MNTAFVLVLLLASGPSPKQFDKAGRTAHAALRDFQRILYEQVQRPDHTWPTPEQLYDIKAKLDIARECIDDSLMVGATMKPGGPVSPQAMSMLRSQVRTIQLLDALVTPAAPKVAHDAMRTLQEAFAKLLKLFPIDKEWLMEHPPARQPAVR